MTVIQFPLDRAAPVAEAPAARDTALPTTSGRRCEYAVGDLARMLGIAHFTPRTVIDLLRAEHREKGMPLPKTPRLFDGKLVAGARSIWLHSRWDAERFDGWKAERDGDGPCPPASAALRADLDRRAAAIARPASNRERAQ